MAISSQEKIDGLKRALAELGIAEDLSWSSEENSYTISGEQGAVLFSVRLPAPERELPEELKPFGWSDYEVDRSIAKGNTKKKTLAGARFELALQDYASALFRERPDVVELEAGVPQIKTIEEFDGYEAQLKEIWAQMQSEHSRLQELERELAESYYLKTPQITKS